ncbi:MAG: NAD-dependent epimerase/dehydratase family protein [Halobacteriales archaeon]|nr:NAD-dependent epimerase/dehydratase family protein [Halobacteriales archaeon]
MTGGAGFIGSHIADALCLDNEVRILDNFAGGDPANCPEEATVIEGDIARRADAWRPLSTASISSSTRPQSSASPGRSRHPETSHAINVDGTLGCPRSRPPGGRPRGVRVECGHLRGRESLPVNETAPKEPTSPYGLEKLSGDHYCRLYADLYGLETVALRYFNVYGPRQSGGDYAGAITAFAEQARGWRTVTDTR